MSQKRIKTDNANLAWKVALRKEGTEGLGPLRVLDLFAGQNRIWSHFETERYYGVEMVKGKGRNLFADNLRVIPGLDLSRFNVIDCDSYGSSAYQVEALFRNPTLRPGTIVFFTDISTDRAGIPNILLDRQGVKEIYKRGPSMFSKYQWDYYLDFLHGLGVDKVRAYSSIERSYRKHYGYFIVPDTSECA